jgi:hypothetical protein
LTSTEYDGHHKPAMFGMTEDQFKQFLAAVTPPACTTPNDLTNDQQRVALSYQLLRNGLVRHPLPAETTSQVLIGITQRVYGDKLELLTKDSIPKAASSLKVTIGPDALEASLLPPTSEGVFATVPLTGCGVGVSLVQFIDARKNAVAAGIPSPLAIAAQDPPPCDERLAALVTAKIEERYGDMATAMATVLAGKKVLIVREEIELSDDPTSDEPSAE